MPIPLALPILSAAVSAIPSIFQGSVASKQMREGQELLRGLERPEKSVPTATQQALTLAAAEYADPTMPGENLMRNRVAASSANAISAAQEGGNPLAVIGKIQANQNKANQNIGIASAERQRLDSASYQNMLNVFGKYQDENWHYNKLAPYQEKYNEGREMIGAGQQNMFGALDRLASIGGTFMNTIGGNGIKVTPTSAPGPGAVPSMFASGIQAANNDMSPQILAMAQMLGRTI